MVNETYMTHLQNIADEYSPDTRQCILDFVEKYKYTNKKLDVTFIVTEIFESVANKRIEEFNKEM